MYTEERKGHLLKDFLLKIILIIIFVLLLIWLVPWPKMDAYLDALNPLKDQIFNANLQQMKNAAIPYYTTERLPENVGDIKKMTLQEMLDMKLLIPFVDKNGDSCDVTASYVSIEKKDTEYLMKVNLKCGEEERYILVHLGCYSYCTTDICEAKPGNTEKPTTKPISTSKPTIKPTTKPTTTPTIKPTPTTVPTIKPTTTPTIKPTSTPTTTPTPTTKPTTTPTIKPTPVPEKEYEYKKTTPASCASWSSWTTKMGTNFTVTNTIYKVVQDLGTKRVQVGIQPAIYQKVVFTSEQLYQVGTHDYKVCTAYNYVVTGGTIYEITGDWKYSGREYRGYNPPAATATSRWVPVGVDFDECGNTCTNHPYGVWKEQTRTAVAHTSEASVTATCTQVETRSIPLYITRTITDTKTVLKQKEQAIMEDRHFYREKTCLNVKEASTSYVWSSYNDTSLLNNGYIYTGKTRNK